jgi:hypothetical protein
VHRYTACRFANLFTQNRISSRLSGLHRIASILTQYYSPFTMKVPLFKKEVQKARFPLRGMPGGMSSVEYSIHPKPPLLT